MTKRAARRLWFIGDLAWLMMTSAYMRLASGRWRLPTEASTVPAHGAPRAAAGPEADMAPVDFRADGEPQVSIVIPVYNHLDQTRHCLRALATVGAQRRFEVIVVDDGSSDGTAEWLGQCTGLRVHRMERNSGFVAACNAGAAIARGEYLVLLNNDTEARPGWLDALIGTFAALPQAGLVGAKLVYPDGSLQEAGGIVFSNGHACNYGRGGDPADPRFNFVREADYCSGACIALPTALFRSLGGFDQRYAPAYYEDTDLAFAVRAAGRQVIYQPRAEVVHFEGVTAGTDVADGVKRFQEINRGHFAAKWPTALREQPDAAEFASAPERCATHRRGWRVLVVDADYPRPDRDSGSMRMLGMLRLLRELGCHVLFWASAALPGNDDSARMLEQQGIELVHARSRAQALRWWYLHGGQIDLAWLSRLPVAAVHMRYERRYAAGAMRVFDTVDLHFLRVEREAELLGDRAGRKLAARMRSEELGLMRRADLTVVVSDHERRLLRELAPSTEVRLLSNVHEVHGSDAPFEARDGLLFLGNFEHAPNVDAARWLIDEIMPALVGRLPQAWLHIVGYGAAAVLGSEVPGNVLIRDHVADLAPILGSVKLALAPLRFGAGVKGKVSMAMSHGVPVVTTSIGAEGMELMHGRDVMIADDAAVFADVLAKLYRDPVLWQSLSMRGLDNVRRHFSSEVARRALQDVLAMLASGARTGSS